MLVGFVRLTTHPRVMQRPLDVWTATDVVQAWLARPNVTVPAPTRRHFALVADLLGPLGAAGPLVTDAHLAALCIEHGAQCVSFDRELSRFAGLDVVEPTDPGVG